MQGRHYVRDARHPWVQRELTPVRWRPRDCPYAPVVVVHDGSRLLCSENVNHIRNGKIRAPMRFTVPMLQYTGLAPSAGVAHAYTPVIPPLILGREIGVHFHLDMRTHHKL